MQLDDRKWTILKAIIKTYLETGEPVADHSTSYIVRTYSFGCWIPALCRPADG